MRAWKMPPKAQSLCFRESTGVNEGKDEKTTNVVLSFGQKRTGSDGKNQILIRQFQLAGCA
jgi:hypothetical protein